MASASAIGMQIDRANESAAIMAAHQRVRYLGKINPVGAQQILPQQAQPTGQFIPPSATANPESTVNASISSDATPVVTSGDSGGGVVIAAGTVGAPAGTTAAVTTGATTGTTAALTAASTLATPTTAAITTTPGQFAAGPKFTTATTAPATNATLTPTLSSTAVPSPARAANPPLGSLRVTPATTTTTTGPVATSSTTTTGGRAVAPIRVMTTPNGSVTVTNVNTAPPTAIKNQ